MTQTPLNVAVFGAGSIGCYVGGQLASAGANIRLIGRERFKKAIEQNGLNLTHYARDPINVGAGDIAFDLDCHDATDADIVLITVKSQDTYAAGQELAKTLNKDTLVISFQNGIGNADCLRDAMPGFTVLGGMVPFNVTGTGPGKLHCGTEGDLWVENHGSPALAEMQHLFQIRDQGCALSNDIAATQWGKLLVNLNNAMNTLCGIPLKACLGQREYRLALAAMIEEALGVLHEAGIKPAKFGKNTPEKMIKVLRLPNLIYRIIMNSVVKIDANARSSMLDDLEAGRTTEIDYLQGEIVKLAAAKGAKAPINATIMSLVKQAFEGGKSPMMSGTDILKAIKNSAPK